MEKIESVCSRALVRNHPWIAAFKGEDATENFVICEQRVLCKLCSIQSALFISFAAYYCFNLEYPIIIKNILYFIQDYIPDSNKKSAAYIAIVSDIKRI